MIKIQKFGPAFGLPDASPFVMKVETYLRMTGQPYEVVTGDVRKAPRKQLPVMEIDGKIIPDSTDIVDHLETARSEKLDAHLGKGDHAVAWAFKTMLEEHLYFGLLFMRWATDDGWTVFEPKLKEMLGAGGVPALMRGMISRTLRKQVITRTARQGIGRKPRAEVAATCATILDAWSDHLAGKPYLCGDKLTTFDATGYAFAASALCPAFDNEVRKHAASKKNLVEYEARMKAAYWKD